MKPITLHKNEYEISTDRARLDLAFIHDFLENQSYWAKNIPFDVMKRSVENALCFGVYHRDRQIGFARVITDFATTAYVADVFIVEAYRGKGLGKWIIKTIVNHCDLQGLRLWLLGTRDAHGLYEKYGFKKLAGTALVERLMGIHDPDAYKKSNVHVKLIGSGDSDCIRLPVPACHVPI